MYNGSCASCVKKEVSCIMHHVLCVNWRIIIMQISIVYLFFWRACKSSVQIYKCFYCILCLHLRTCWENYLQHCPAFVLWQLFIKDNYLSLKVMSYNIYCGKKSSWIKTTGHVQVDLCQAVIFAVYLGYNLLFRFIGM